jgi:RecA/RadA recombinase
VSGREVRPLRPTASDGLVPPHDEPAEQAVLGAVLLSAAALPGLIAGGLRPDHFYRPRNGVIYAAMLALAQEREAVDPVTVCDRLRRGSELTQAGGKAYVHSLPTLVPAVGAVLEYAAIVRRHALARGLLERIRAWEAELLRRRDPDQVLREAIGELLRVDAPHGEGPVVIEELLHELMDELEERADRGGGLRGLASGFPDVDDITGGFRRGDLVVLAGRPSMGKTQLALNIASHAALAEEAGVLVFTLEMSREAAGGRSGRGVGVASGGSAGVGRRWGLERFWWFGSGPLMVGRDYAQVLEVAVRDAADSWGRVVASRDVPGLIPAAREGGSPRAPLASATLAGRPEGPRRRARPGPAAPATGGVNAVRPAGVSSRVFGCRTRSLSLGERA